MNFETFEDAILEGLQTELGPAVGTTFIAGMRHEGAGLVAELAI
jgi:hypothetical protein